MCSLLRDIQLCTAQHLASVVFANTHLTPSQMAKTGLHWLAFIRIHFADKCADKCIAEQYGHTVTHKSWPCNGYVNEHKYFVKGADAML